MAKFIELDVFFAPRETRKMYINAEHIISMKDLGESSKKYRQHEEVCEVSTIGGVYTIASAANKIIELINK